MKLRAALIAGCLAALGACGAPQGGLEEGFSYRDQSVPMGVTSRYDERRFEGSWHVRARIPVGEPTELIRFEDRATGLQMQVSGLRCGSGQACVNISDTLQVFRDEGAGRYLVQMADGRQRRMWVIWVDEGFRTAVVGNPEGTFAWVLDRQQTGGADRIRAAREILDFNGYDVRQLKEASS